jgi:hypothetical protein
MIAINNGAAYRKWQPRRWRWQPGAGYPPDRTIKFGGTLMLIRCLLARARRWLSLLALLAALPLSSGVAARPAALFLNCSASGDAWFVEELSLAPRTIAPGVLVEPLTPAEPRSDERLARLSNTTDTPLYLVEMPYYRDWDFYTPASPISLTEPLVVIQRIVADQVALWDAADNRSSPRWLSEPGSLIYIYRDHPEQILPSYLDRQRYADDRPADAVAPSPITYTLSVIYGDKLFAIPVTQRYQLNPGYDPDKERNKQAECDSWGENLVKRPIAFMVTVGALVRWCLGIMILLLATVILFVLGSAASRHVRGRP